MTPQEALNLLSELANSYTGFSIQGARNVLSALSVLQEAITPKPEPQPEQQPVTE